MKSFTKKIVRSMLGVLLIALAACAPGVPVQTATPPIGQTPDDVAQTPVTGPPNTALPTNTVGIPVTGPDLTNTRWSLVSFGEQGTDDPVIEGTDVTLEFEANGQAGGSGGCNMFSAQYDIQDSTISFDQIISTEIACTGEGVMEQEQRYFQALQSANGFDLTDDRLVIHYGEGMLNFTGSDNQTSPTPVSGLLCSTVGEGLKPGWHLCRSQTYGFEVQYPPNAELIDHTATSARVNLPFAPDVNLTEKYLTISATEDLDECSSPLAEGRATGSFSREPVQINGLEFIKEAGQEAATGSVYNWEAYSIDQGSECISLGFVLRSFRPQIQATPPARFDLQEESEIFTEIVSTFMWLESQRIEFDAGETSATVTAQLQPSGSDQYVLRALQGQTMTVDLSFPQGEAILAVWGEDGTVLLSDHPEASSFQGVLPSTQDYYILVKGTADGQTEYNLKIEIPPRE